MAIQSSFRSGGSSAWLRKLLDCPSVSVIEAGGGTATIEAAGVPGLAVPLEAGLCVGVQIAIDAEPASQWLHDATLALAAMPAACDDALQCDKGNWLLWHRYSHGVDARQLEEGLALQLALARRLAESAIEDGGGPGQAIGKLI